MASKLDCRDWDRRAALGHHVAGVVLALAALGGDAELELDLVKTHASTCVTRKFAVGDTVADADDHVCWRVKV